MEPRHFKGTWWPNEKPEEKFSGTANYKPQSGIIKLYRDNLLDSWIFQGRIPFDEKDFKTQFILNGETTESELITIPIRGCSGVPSTKDTKDSIHYRFFHVFIGDHFDSMPKFSELKVTFNGLSEWLVLLSSRQKRKHEEEWIKINLDSAQITLCTGNSEGNQLEENGRNQNFIKINLDEKLTFSKINQKYLKPLRRYIALVTGTPVQPTSITGINSSYDRDISILIHIPRFAPEDRAVEPSDIEINPAKINIEQSLLNWFEIEREAEHILDTYFAQVYNPHLYEEMKFLLLATGLESYFGYLYPKYKIMEEDEFENLQNDILEAIPDDANSKNRIYNLIDSIGNQPSFRDKINMSVDETKPVIEEFMDFEKALSSIRDIRHGIAHGYDEGKSRRDERKNLRYISIITKSIILDLIGLENDDIKEILKKDYSDLFYSKNEEQPK